jgi:hypothetical protein
MLQEMDSAPGTDITTKWMTPDYRLVVNGSAIDLAGYREMNSGNEHGLLGPQARHPPHRGRG